MATRFSASPSKPMKAGGISYCLLMLGLSGMFFGIGIMTWGEGGGTSGVMIAAGLLCLLLFAGSLLFIPLGYRLTTTALIVRRWGPKVVIPLAEIREARRIKLTNVLRTCGAGGVFGSWGKFSTDDRSQGFGNFTAYVTRNDTEVAIFRKQGEPIVLSPDQPEEFIAAVMERIGPRD